MPAWIKLIGLAILTFVVLSSAQWQLLLIFLVLILITYLSLHRAGRRRLVGFRSLLPLVLGIGVFQALVTSPHAATLSMLKMMLMIMAADLITATTPTQALLTCTEAVLRLPMRILGYNPRRLGLAVSLMFRFIPVLAAQWRDQREAWSARAGSRPGLRLLISFVDRTLWRTDQIAESLSARQQKPGR